MAYGFKNVNIVVKKTKSVYAIRLATPQEVKQTEDSDNWRIPKADRPKKISGCHLCTIYPPNYKENTVAIQSDKMYADFNFKTGEGKIFIKGMGNYSGHPNSFAMALYGVKFDFMQCPEVIQATLNELPSKGTLQDTGMGVRVQY